MPRLGQYRVFSTSETSGINKIVLAQDGDLLFTGNIDDNILFGKIDSNLTLKFSKSVGGSGRESAESIFEAMNGDIVSIGHSSLGSYKDIIATVHNSQGDNKYTKFFVISNLDDEIYDAQLDANKNWIMSGYTTDEDTKKKLAIVLKTSSDGSNIITSKVINNSSVESIAYSIISNSGIIKIGGKFGLNGFLGLINGSDSCFSDITVLNLNSTLYTSTKDVNMTKHIPDLNLVSIYLDNHILNSITSDICINNYPIDINSSGNNLIYSNLTENIKLNSLDIAIISACSSLVSICAILVIIQCRKNKIINTQNEYLREKDNNQIHNTKSSDETNINNNNHINSFDDNLETIHEHNNQLSLNSIAHISQNNKRNTVIHPITFNNESNNNSHNRLYSEDFYNNNCDEEKNGCDRETNNKDSIVDNMMHNMEKSRRSKPSFDHSNSPISSVFKTKRFTQNNNMTMVRSHSYISSLDNFKFQRKKSQNAYFKAKVLYKKNISRESLLENVNNNLTNLKVQNKFGIRTNPNVLPLPLLNQFSNSAPTPRNNNYNQSNNEENNIIVPNQIGESLNSNQLTTTSMNPIHIPILIPIPNTNSFSEQNQETPEKEITNASNHLRIFLKSNKRLTAPTITPIHTSIPNNNSSSEYNQTSEIAQSPSLHSTPMETPTDRISYSTNSASINIVEVRKN